MEKHNNNLYAVWHIFHIYKINLQDQALANLQENCQINQKRRGSDFLTFSNFNFPINFLWLTS